MKFPLTILMFAALGTLRADEAPAKLPVITLPVRIHLVQSDTIPAMHTTLAESDIRRILGKVNKVWAQAGIQFEIESIGPTTAIALPPGMEAKQEYDRVHAMIPKERLSPTAIDVCYVKEVKPNGFYYGEPVVVKDTASLRKVTGGLDEPLPRVTSHEIGHALGLKHRQELTNLMASGTTGFSLNDEEIAIARGKALERLPASSRAAMQASIGKAFLHERNFSQARAEFSKALAMPDASDALKADTQLHIGLTYYEAQDYERAKPELLQVLDMPGRDVRPPWDKGRIGYRPEREAMLRLRLRNLIPDDRKVMKVLFIGSSHTVRGDIPGLVMQLAASAPAERPRIIAGDFVRMGTGITTYWNDGDTPDTARGLIAAEPWDAVVFETFFTVKYENMLKYAALFTDLIRSKNAKAVIYESPAAKAASYPDVFRKFHDENVALSKTLRIPVAPSVHAWMQYLGPKPTPEQFGTLYADFLHATPKGAYLSACCIYSALTGCSPVGLAHPGLSDDEAKIFQQAAWKAFLETNPDAKP